MVTFGLALLGLVVLTKCETLEFDSTNPIGFIHFYQVYDAGSNPPISVSKTEVDVEINGTTQSSWTSFLYENIISDTSFIFHSYNFLYSSDKENIKLEEWTPSYFVNLLPFNNSNIDYISSGYTQSSNSTNYANIAAPILFNNYDSFDDLILFVTNIIFISKLSGNNITFSWYALYEEIFGNETIINGDCNDDFIVNAEGVTSICNYYMIIDEITRFGDIMNNTNNLEADIFETLLLSSSYIQSLNQTMQLYIRFIPYLTILCRNDAFCQDAFNISANPTMAPTIAEPTLSPTPNLELPFCVSFNKNSNWSNEWDNSNTIISQRDYYIEIGADSCTGTSGQTRCVPSGYIIKYFNTIGYVNITIKFKIKLIQLNRDDSIKIRSKCWPGSWQTLATYAKEDETYNKALKLPSSCDNNAEDIYIMFQLTSLYQTFYVYDICICADNDGDNCTFSDDNDTPSPNYYIYNTTSSNNTSSNNTSSSYTLGTLDTIYIVLWIFYFLSAIVVAVFSWRKSTKDKPKFDNINDLKEFADENMKGQICCGCLVNWILFFLIFAVIPMTTHLMDNSTQNEQYTECQVTSVRYDSFRICSVDGEQGRKYKYIMKQKNGELFDNDCTLIVYETDSCDTDGQNYYDGDTVDCISYTGSDCEGELGSQHNFTDLYGFAISGFILYLFALCSYYMGFTYWRNIGMYCVSFERPINRKVERGFEEFKQEKIFQKKRVQMTQTVNTISNEKEEYL